MVGINFGMGKFKRYTYRRSKRNNAPACVFVGITNLLSGNYFLFLMAPWGSYINPIGFPHRTAIGSRLAGGGGDI